jgi:glucokinase
MYTIGIDVGGTNTKFGVVDKAGNILKQDRILTNADQDVSFFIQNLAEKLQPMIDEFGGKNNFKGIGMGAPNANYYKGTIEYAANLKAWKGVIPMAELMQNQFSLETKLTNDANAAAMGEMMYGVTKDIRHFITITLGTGVGSGIVIDGKIVLGCDGFAGELGHVTVRPGGRLHKGTGMRGTLETYASATGVRETVLEFLSENPNEPSLLRNYKGEDITSEVVYNCAMQGDAIAIRTFEFTGQILGEALAAFVLFSSPEAIVLFGGLTKAGDLLLNPTHKAMEENILTAFKGKVKLLVSTLKEADAAILGASALVC